MNRKIITDNGVSRSRSLLIQQVNLLNKPCFPIMSGHYHCNKDYYIERDYMDMFLSFMFEGKLACSVGEKFGR